MSILPALETGNVTQVFLGGCRWVGTALTVASSIPISILGATMVMRTPSIGIMASMVMVKVSSRVRGKTGSLLSSRIVLPLSILPLAVVNLLLLPFNHESSVY